MNSDAILPCEIAAAKILPSIRAALAIVLVVKLNTSKYEVAKMLGLTPAAVTNYIEGKRGSVYLRRILADKELYSLINELAKLIRENGGLQGDALKRYQEVVCTICNLINEKKCPQTSRHGMLV